MSDLPSGTVTFLFTDIEGSTKLLDELGAERYAGALAEHRRILREPSAPRRVRGRHAGDAFFVAFSTAPRALAAAADALAGLASGPIRLRMGVHTGTPHLAEEGYAGVDVHRAARIAACGHGGQVLVSATTAALAGTEGLRDLGEHRLKDLSTPERLYQLGDGEFAPLKSLHQTNLPIPATPFLGRERELQQVLELLESAPLLALTGPGGMGKTRLGLQAAPRRRTGIRTASSGCRWRRCATRSWCWRPRAGCWAPRTAWSGTSPTGRCCCSWTTSSTSSRPPLG